MIHKHNEMLVGCKENEIMRFAGEGIEPGKITQSEITGPRKTNAACLLLLGEPSSEFVDLSIQTKVSREARKMERRSGVGSILERGRRTQVLGRQETQMGGGEGR